MKLMAEYDGKQQVVYAESLSAIESQLAILS